QKDRTAAIGAGDRDGLIPRSEFALRITVAAVKNFAPAGFPFLDVAFLALRTLDTKIHRFFERLDIFAFGITAAAEKSAEFPPTEQHGSAAELAGFVDFFLGNDLNAAVIVAFEVLGVPALWILRTSEEFAVAAPFDHHLCAALIAVDIGGHFLPLDIAHFFFGLFQIPRERRVKALHRLGPLLFAVLDFVELIFHAGSELDIQNVRKAFHQQIGHQKTQIRRRERTLFVLDDILAIENIRDDRG